VPANIFLGRELMRPRGRGPFLDLKRMEAEAKSLLARLKIDIPDVRQPVRTMSGGQRQCVAIARSVCFNARVVILDEPTAALGVQETGKVHDLVREMRAQGLAVVLISHNLNHVFELCDRITVMKTGRVAGTRPVTDTDHEEILRLIVTGGPSVPPVEPAPLRQVQRA
jgi:D-xylose transport system ATP-binding protein